ncbi:hypothetical protein JANAI62_32550 [Jannaschia pagri]|uniref:Asparaginase n=2 Tax=Roseobacteraceae TaxID=2854170 RepID=A0ABQ4NQG6_9RHOB|nr:hypothetical protein JANAI61_32550 [Jannaschia sp. AI_61]GIT96632.1 hypothetical protein JANAI62_32550 [Jannaschia sp. AI_62]
MHRGHAVICDGSGTVLEAWGNPDAVIFPRSSAKMIQALPLLETGAGRDLTSRHLALACASHRGLPRHAQLAAAWLSDMGLSDDDLRCGAHAPFDREAADDLVRAKTSACQVHNNCSGKHCGFLMVGQKLGGGPDYVAPDHPVQRAVLQTFEEVTGTDSPGIGIDGCSAPNPATPLRAFGAAMGKFARAPQGNDPRAQAMTRLIDAMATHPDLVAGPGAACTEIMGALAGRGVVKTGAEGVYIAILPDLDRGIAVKISDGTTRASEAVIAALLVHLGALAPTEPVVTRLTHGPMRNVRGTETGHLRVTL